jgi:hypothetical protein
VTAAFADMYRLCAGWRCEGLGGAPLVLAGTGSGTGVTPGDDGEELAGGGDEGLRWRLGDDVADGLLVTATGSGYSLDAR